MRILVTILGFALAGCDSETVAGPIGMHLHFRPDTIHGSYSEWVRAEAGTVSACPAYPTPSSAWALQQVPGLNRGIALLQPIDGFDMQVIGADSSALAAGRCRLHRVTGAGVLETISMIIPGRARDSAHFAILRTTFGESGGVVAFSWATSRTLRDSLVGAADVRSS